MNVLRVGIGVLTMVGTAVVAEAQEQKPVLRIGFSYSSPPHSWYDVKASANRGYMLDIAGAVARDAGMQVSYTGATHQALIDLLAAGKIDVVATVWGPTEPRRAVAEFSSPVYTFPEALLVRESDAQSLRTFADLVGKTVSSVPGGGGEAKVRAAPGVTFLAVPAIPDMLASVADGRAHATWGTMPTMLYYAQQGTLPAGTAIATSWEPTTQTTVGFAVRKDATAILQAVNTSLTKLTADGTVAGIITGYGLSYSPPSGY